MMPRIIRAIARPRAAPKPIETFLSVEDRRKSFDKIYMKMLQAAKK